MSEENTTGEEVTEAAAPPTEVKEEAQPEQQEKEQMVPLSALQSERALRQQKEQDLQLLRDNFEIYRANMQHQREKKPPEGLDAMSENDVLTVGEYKKSIEGLSRQYQLTIEELRMTQKYPDYQEVVTKHLPEVLKINPALEGTLRATQDYELAYYLAKNSESYKADTKKKQIHADAERIVQNSQKTGSLSSVGSASPISQAKRYREMSEADFMKEVQKNMGYV